MLMPFLFRPEMVVGWYHSHPGFGCWLSGVDINTQQVSTYITDFLNSTYCIVHVQYRIERNFGGCKLWRICYKNTVGEINFGEFERL